MSTKADMRRTFTVGSTWTRVHHQAPSHVGGEIVEKGQPVKLKVIAQDKDGVIFELPTGENSWLSWPQSQWIDATFTPNLVTLTNRYGPLLTYTRDMGVAEAIVDTLLEGDEEDMEQFMQSFRKSYAVIPGTFLVWGPKESWSVDYRGNPTHEFINSNARPADLHDISGFDLEEWKRRHGRWPEQNERIPLADISWYGPSGERDRHECESERNARETEAYFRQNDI